MSGIKGLACKIPFIPRSQPLLRAFLASAAIAAAVSGLVVLGASVTISRHMQPLSESMLAELKAKKMEKESPILVRIFKEEAEFGVWKQMSAGVRAPPHLSDLPLVGPAGP